MELNLSVMVVSQSRMENFSFRQFWVEYMLTILPLHPEHENCITSILSCLANQLCLYRVSLFVKKKVPNVLSIDIPLVVFAAERILAYYLTKKHAMKGENDEVFKTGFIGYVADSIGDNILPWTEYASGTPNHDDDTQSIDNVVPAIFCEILFVFHYCLLKETNSVKLKKNLATLKFRIIKFFESFFKLDAHYTCDIILNSWDLWYDNKFYTDALDVLFCFLIIFRSNIISPGHCILFYQIATSNHFLQLL